LTFWSRRGSSCAQCQFSFGAAIVDSFTYNVVAEKGQTWSAPRAIDDNARHNQSIHPERRSESPPDTAAAVRVERGGKDSFMSWAAPPLMGRDTAGLTADASGRFRVVCVDNPTVAPQVWGAAVGARR
jgi:hypothetical protein